jgi:hypothetical protein
MKFVINLLGLAAFGSLGYVAEPFLRGFLTHKVQGQLIVTQEETASLSPAAAAIDLTKLAPNQLPERVLLYADAKVMDSTSGVSLKIEAGNQVKLLRIENNQAVISPGTGPFEGTVPVSGTDLLQQLSANPPTIAPDTPPVTPEPAPAEVASISAPAPEEMTQPPSPAPAASADVVGAMQASIRVSQIQEFKFDQVQQWTEEPDETFDGESYKIGVASYKAETMFGVRVIQAKALIQEGIVRRWVHRKSGLEIK